MGTLFHEAWLQAAPAGLLSSQDISKVIHHLEVLLPLPPGFLTDDIIICEEMHSLTPTDLNEADAQALVIHLLRDIKVIDHNKNRIYGSFDDGHTWYTDGSNQIKKEYEDVELESDVDFDDTATLMDELKDEFHSRHTSVDFDQVDPMDFLNQALHKPPNQRPRKIGFSAGEELEEILTHHQDIELRFAQVQAQVASLEMASLEDLRSLNRLLALDMAISQRLEVVKRDIAGLTKAITEERTEKTSKVVSPTPYPHFSRNEDDSTTHTLATGVVCVLLMLIVMYLMN